MSPELIATISIGVTLALALLAVAYKTGQVTTQVKSLVEVVTAMSEENKEINTRVSRLEGAAGD